MVAGQSISVQRDGKFLTETFDLVSNNNLSVKKHRNATNKFRLPE